LESVRVWSSTWNLDPFLIISILATAVVYVRGFRRVRIQLPQHFPGWRRDLFLVALAILFFALSSPLDGLADLLLQAHMAQHWLLVMVVAPLIWLGAPSVPLMRGLPGQTLQKGLGPLLASPTIRSTANWLTRPMTAWCLWVATMLIWHWPPAYQSALQSRAWHDLEHASFLSAALLLWYPIIRPWPKTGADPVGGRLIYIAATMVFNTFFSATFAFSGQIFYETYQSVPRPWAISALRDQNAAGAFMWIASSIPMLIASVAVVIQWLSPGYASPLTHPLVTKPAPHSGRPRWFFSLRLRRGIQVALFLLAIVVVIDGFVGTQSPSAENLAGVLPWTYWRGFVVIGLLALGNLFCAVCPFTLPRRLAAKLLGRPFRWPSWLQNKWLAATLFGLYLWAYEVLALWDRPSWTAWLILGYFLFAFMIEGLFPRGTFCRYLCPIGQFNFTGASLSPLEVHHSRVSPRRLESTRLPDRASSAGQDWKS
jgi:cytochrome c oxidase assembly factor CtaG